VKVKENISLLIIPEVAYLILGVIKILTTSLAMKAQVISINQPRLVGERM